MKKDLCVYGTSFQYIFFEISLFQQLLMNNYDYIMAIGDLGQRKFYYNLNQMINIKENIY